MAQGELAVLGGVPCDVLVEEGRIAALGAGLAPRRGAPRLDAAGLVVAPGFIDLQVNGGYGIDLTAEPERVGELAQRLLAGGVTAFLPTLVSPTEEEIRRALAVPAPLGWHLEGPLLNPARRGAHPLERLGPLPPSAFSPGVALVTLAPEQPGAAQAAAALAARGVVVAAGHTEATPAQLAAAGVRYVTHLFNAMAELHHRRPGPVGWALGAPIATVGLIADGRHVDPVAFAAAWAALGSRANLVSDASAGLGLPPGPCTLAGAPARVGADGAVR
ncbi:MAG: N-acetylglucosamine 6-phosphate deacetylase, partial [Acidimicrobiales bacterium]